MSKRFSDPITLFSGLPGHGKTLMAITYAIEARREGQRVFQLGIKDCNSSVAELFDPPALSADDLVALGVEYGKPFQRWRELPPGSILILDEAQDFLPVRGPGRPPVWISELARLRHYGVQLWLITQDVRNLDSFVRRLIGAHCHIERKLGLRSAVVFRWEHVSEDTRDYHARKSSSKSAFKHDKKNYQFYTSSTQHLVKRKIPWQIYVVIPVFFAMCVSIYFIVRLVTGHSSLTSLPRSDLLSGGDSSSSSDVPVSAKVYLDKFLPRVPGAMWSAPLFDGRKVAASPELYCYSSEIRGCRCFTEQMTRVAVPMLSCLRIVKDGLYNPFRVVSRVVSSSPVGVSVSPSSSGRDLGVGSSVSSSSSSSGDIAVVGPSGPLVPALRVQGGFSVPVPDPLRSDFRPGH